MILSILTACSEQVSKNSNQDDSVAHSTQKSELDSTDPLIVHVDRNNIQSSPSQNAEKSGAKTLKKNGIIFFDVMGKKKAYNFSFYPNEFVGSQILSNAGDQTESIMPFTSAMAKIQNEPILPSRLWFQTYYVPLDSANNWNHKQIIQGQYIQVDGFADGLLHNFITIHFKNTISEHEFKLLIDQFKLEALSKNANLRVHYSKKQGRYTTAIIKEILADKFIEICNKIAQKPFVDWVENHLYTGEPDPLHSF